jgi:hypothetical protein
MFHRQKPPNVTLNPTIPRFSIKRGNRAELDVLDTQLDGVDLASKMIGGQHLHLSELNSRTDLTKFRGTSAQL